MRAAPVMGLLSPQRGGRTGRQRRRRRVPDAHLRTRRVCARMAAFGVVLSRVRVYLVNPCFQIASYTSSTQPPQPEAVDGPRGRSRAPRSRNSKSCTNIHLILTVPGSPVLPWGSPHHRRSAHRPGKSTLCSPVAGGRSRCHLGLGSCSRVCKMTTMSSF